MKNIIEKNGSLLFWHKILFLLSGSIILLTLGIAFAIWYSLDMAGQNMGRESKMIFSSQTEKFIEKLVKGQAKTLDIQLKQALTAAKYGALYISENLEHHKLDEIETERILSMLHANTSHCKTVYFVSISGDIKFHPPKNPDLEFTPGFNPAEESFFPKPDKFISQNTQSVWSEVHEDPFSLNYDLVIDAAAPVLSDNMIFGYVGVSISLGRLITQFNQHQPIRSSYSFLIDTRQQLIGAPPHGRIELSSSDVYKARGILDVSETGNPELDIILKRMVMGETAIRKIIIRNELKYIACHSMRNINWRIGLVVPVKMAASASLKLVNALEKGTHQALMAVLFWAASLFILAFSGGILLSRQIAAPIKELSDAAKEIAKGNFSTRVKISARDEIGSLGLTFNTMTDKIESMVRNLTEVNEQLRLKNVEIEGRREQYRILLETMNEGIISVDENGFIIYVNKKFCDMLAYLKDEIIGKPVHNFLDKQGLKIYKKQMEKRRKGASDPYKIAWIMKDSRQFQAIVSPVPIFDAEGNFRGSFGVINDILELNCKKR